MKNFYLTLFISSILCAACYSQNVLTEDFDFTPADSLENSGQWNRSGINTEYNIKIVSPGLEYPNYVGSGIGNSCLLANEGNGDIVFRNFSSSITTGSAYMSFLIRVDSLPDTFTQGYCISFNPNTGGTNLNTALHIKKLSASSFDFGVRKLSSVKYTNLTYSINKTYLIVLKYSIIPGTSNDSSSLYIFANGVPNSEPNAPVASTIEGDDYTGQGSVYLNNNYAQNGLQGCHILIDGIRVGNSWTTSVLAMLSSVSSAGSKFQLQHEIYPNPLQDNTVIKYQIPEKGLVQIQIINSAGIIYADLLREIQESGSHELIWNRDNLPAGMYSCKIQFNHSEISNKKLLIQ